MKVKFLSNNEVEVVLEVHAVHRRPLNERKVYNTEHVMNEFKKLHPKRQIVKVLQKSKVKNFSENGKVKGVWRFELKSPPKIKPKITAAPKRAPRKKSAKKATKEG